MKPPFKGVIYNLFCSFLNFCIKIKRAQILLRVWLKTPNLVVVPATLSLSYALKPRSLARRVFEIQVSTVPLCGVRSRPAVYRYIIAKLSSSRQVQLNLSWRKLYYHCQCCPTGPDPTRPDQKCIKTAFYSKTCFVKLVLLVELTPFGRRPQFFSKWKTASIFVKWKKTSTFSNGSRPQYLYK